MPLPTPDKKENEPDFIARCMENEVMKNEWPNIGKRLGVCYTQWEKK